MTTPIVIVPGIMGTRLSDRRGTAVWDPDPDGTWANVWMVRHLRTLLDLEIPLRPAPTARQGASLIRERGVVHGAGLVWPAYDRLVRTLSSSALAGACAGGTKVYVAGYDWRQSNRLSAQRLARIVHQAIRETGAPRVIVVAHSMGGLVTRYACRQLTISGRRVSDMVAGAVFMGSPTLGASATYRILRQSFVSADELADIDLSEVDSEGMDAEGLDLLGRYGARLARRLPSVHEMLPGRQFCARHPDWVDFSMRAAGGLRDASSPARLYRNAHAGIPDLSSAMFGHWDTFDRRVGTYVPPRTMMLYSDGHDTETMYRVSGRSLERAGTPSQNRGDGRVPTDSGAAAGLRWTGGGRLRVPSADHGGIANGAASVRRVARAVVSLCPAVHAGVTDGGRRPAEMLEVVSLGS